MSVASACGAAAGAAAILLAALGAIQVADVAASPTAIGAKSEFKIVEKEWAIKRLPRRVKAGRMTFLVHNRGKVAHDLVVVRTNRRPNALPIKNRRAVTKGMVARIGTFKPGAWRGVTLSLRPGRYVFLCNLRGHYKAGMRAGLRVVR